MLKILSVIVIALILASVIVIPALSKENGEDEEREDKAKEKGKQKVEKAKEKGKQKIEYKFEIDKSVLELEVEIKDFEDDTYKVLLECASVPEGASNILIDNTITVEDSEGELEIKKEVAEGEYKGCTLTIASSVFKINDFSVDKTSKYEEHKERGLKVKSEILGNLAVVKIKDEFIVESLDEQEIADMILERLNITASDIANIMKVKVKEKVSNIAKDGLEVKIFEDDDVVNVKFSYNILLEGIDVNELPEVIADRLASIKASDIIESIKVNEFKPDVVKNVLNTLKDKVGKDMVKDIDFINRTIGRDVAVLSMSLSLHAIDGSNGFGKADILMFKNPAKEFGRIIIRAIVDTDADKLSACYNGENIGELKLVNTNVFKVGMLRVTMGNVIISLPEISIVDGEDCKAQPILTNTLG